SGAPGWRRLLDAYPTEAALVPIGSPCPVATLPDWELVLRSSVALVYARTGTAAWSQLRAWRAAVPDDAPRAAAAIGIFPWGGAAGIAVGGYGPSEELRMRHDPAPLLTCRVAKCHGTRKLWAAAVEEIPTGPLWQPSRPASRRWPPSWRR